VRNYELSKKYNMSKTAVLALPYGHSISTKSVFYIMLALIVMMFSMYVYLVNATVMNVVARQDTERAISSLSTSIGELEFKYIGLKNSVTLELAHAKGFKDTSPSSFLARNKSTLSYNSAR
jgi:hypothetical protein